MYVAGCLIQESETTFMLSIYERHNARPISSNEFEKSDITREKFFAHVEALAKSSGWSKVSNVSYQENP